MGAGENGSGPPIGEARSTVPTVGPCRLGKTDVAIPAGPRLGATRADVLNTATRCPRGASRSGILLLVPAYLPPGGQYRLKQGRCSSPNPLPRAFKYLPAVPSPPGTISIAVDK